MALFISGVILQILADKNNKEDVKNIVGTILGGVGILIALAIHFLTNIPLNGRLKHNQEIFYQLQEARRIQQTQRQAEQDKSAALDDYRQQARAEKNLALDGIRHFV